VPLHGRRVTQWRCLNDCYRLAETRREKLVNGAWAYCDEPSDPAILGPLPISTLPKYATIQTRLMRIRTNIVNVEMVKDDGGHITAQYPDIMEVTNLEDPGNVPTDDGGRISMRYNDYMEVFCKIWQRVWHRTSQLTTLSIWNQASIYHMAESTILPIIIACGSTGRHCEEGRRTADACGLPSSQSSHGEELISSSTDHGDAR